MCISAPSVFWQNSLLCSCRINSSQLLQSQLEEGGGKGKRGRRTGETEREGVSRLSQLAKSGMQCKITTVGTSPHLCLILFTKSKSKFQLTLRSEAMNKKKWESRGPLKSLFPQNFKLFCQPGRQPLSIISPDLLWIFYLDIHTHKYILSTFDYSLIY